jgi:hypothetical protein
MSDDEMGEPTEPQLGSWILPGHIVERTTAGNRWIERGGVHCSHCRGEIAGPTYYDVEFRVAPGPDGARHWGLGFDTCSRACAERLAARAPQRPPSRMATEGNPTDPGVRGDGWIFAFRAVGEYPEDTDRSGKWLVFLPVDEIDAFWARVREAVRAGRLGDSAKVATRATTDRQRGIRTHVVCIYTYDHADTADVWRIRRALRVELGVTWRIAYKADEATAKGQYAASVQRVSLYYA